MGVPLRSVAPASALTRGDYRNIQCSPGVAVRVPRDAAVEDEICRVVARLHCVGHPSQQDLSRLLASQKAKPETYVALKGLKCEYCLRHQPPPAPRSTALPRDAVCHFGELISMDIFYIHSVTVVTIQVLGIVDREVLHLVARIWFQCYGCPQEVVTDCDGAFRGEFSERLVMRGVHHRIISGEAHWQLARAERNNFVLKHMLVRLQDEQWAQTRSSLTCHLCLIQCLHARNSMLSRNGRSPFMAAFGRTPRVPTVLQDTRNTAVQLESLESPAICAEA
eukprot:3335326-Amphidinium_carterae.1